MIYTKFGLNFNTLKKNFFLFVSFTVGCTKISCYFVVIRFCDKHQIIEKKKAAEIPCGDEQYSCDRPLDLWTFVAFKSLSRSLSLCKTCDQNDGTGSCIVLVECWGQLLTISHPSEQLHKSQGCLWMTTEVLEPCWLT